MRPRPFRHALAPVKTHPVSVATACPGCGISLPDSDGPTHAYLNASPACWALYGEILAREYSDLERFVVHQLTVDTYAVQHSVGSDPRSRQSLALHLMTLCLFLERGADPRTGPALHKRLIGRRVEQELDPPRPNGDLTVAYVYGAVTPDEHIDRVERWARDVWEAWAPHHHTIRRWLDESFSSPRP